MPQKVKPVTGCKVWRPSKKDHRIMFMSLSDWDFLLFRYQGKTFCTHIPSSRQGLLPYREICKRSTQAKSSGCYSASATHSIITPMCYFKFPLSKPACGLFKVTPSELPEKSRSCFHVLFSNNVVLFILITSKYREVWLNQFFFCFKQTILAIWCSTYI